VDLTEEEARVIALSTIPASTEPLTLSELEQCLAAAADRPSVASCSRRAAVSPDSPLARSFIVGFGGPGDRTEFVACGGGPGRCVAHVR
jgi:hypothetical protein